ncbi:hypothetical protein TGVAND_299820 [Toxoplasma gondii VAND]|uniref:Uncharacterized protein n=1 Tax=Toxoplasma gondii VAND TaxID=933077 RepID=A0A086PGY4_TOXGO|nr:hypothetical protein TGVAND_299820 [Toxoplasma gondii VAND]
MDASFYSPLTSLFEGHLQQPSLTLDLPLLHASRPHKLPPSLLLPTHAFLLPEVRPTAKQVLPLSLQSSHVFDCSFVPQHPSLLVCSSAPAGFVVALDLATGQAVQSFLLPPASSRLDGANSVVSSLYTSTNPAYPALTAAHMHGDPSSPLLFLGTSVGDIFAYDLRFAGRGAGVYGHPTLHLERAHDGVVSSLRAGGGSNLSAARPPSLPSHVLVSGGLQDNWIRLFDLRFPFHYSVGFSETQGGSLSRTNRDRLARKQKSRGNVPYPMDALQLNPGCRSAEGGRNAFCSSAFSATQELLERSEGETSRDGVFDFDACEQLGENRIMRMRNFGGEGREVTLPCHCCSDTGSACGIVAMDLSPDSSLLAVAQLRAVLKETKAAPPMKDSLSPQREMREANSLNSCMHNANRGALPVAVGATLERATDSKAVRSRAVKEWEADAMTPFSGVRTPEDRVEVQQAGSRQFGRNFDDPLPAGAGAAESETLRLGAPRGDLRLVDSVSKSPGGCTPDVTRTRRNVWRVEGETTILSVSEGLKVMKTLAVADASFFTSVEFSRNGKHLLLGGGASESSFCVDCRACSCCCLCFASQRRRDKGPQWNDEDGLRSELRSQKVQNPPRVSLSGNDAADACQASPGSTPAPCSVVSTPDDDHENWKHPNRFVRRSLAEAERGPPQTPEARPAHRAQLVNILQSNRLAVLKSPADGALAFAESVLLQHSLSVETQPPSAFHSPVAWPPKGLDNVQISQVSPPPLLHSSHASASLRLRLFSPDSETLDRRRRAFWRASAAPFPHFSGDEDDFVLSPYSSSAARASQENKVNRDSGDHRDNAGGADHGAKGCTKGSTANEDGDKSRFGSSVASFASVPVNESSKPLASRERTEERMEQRTEERRETRIGQRGEERRKERGAVTSREGAPESAGRQATTPFPKCHPQISQFLSACGPLHPQWGRPSCMHDRFVVGLWGGLVAGIGGSPLYPGLKLWQATTGVVLSWTEGVLATPEAVRCVRGHSDLSTGLLVTAGALPVDLAVEKENRLPSSGGLSTGQWQRKSAFCSQTQGERKRATRPGVTLWSLVHRDVLLETALKKQDEGESDFLLVDPDDEGGPF